MKLPGQIACALAFAYAFSVTTASATPILAVYVENKTYGVGTASGFFDVVVTNSGSATDILDTTARVFEHIVNANVVFGTPTVTTTYTPIHSFGFFNHNGGITNTASNVSDNYGGGAQDTIGTGQSFGLMQVPFTILNGFVGSIQIDVDNNPDNTTGTSLLMPDGINYYPYSVESGILTIVPEPASLLLLGLSVPLLMRRRVRS